MKRYLCILLLICSVVFANAQEVKKLNNFPHHEISFGYGAPSALGLLTNALTFFGGVFFIPKDSSFNAFYIGPISATYAYSFTKLMSAGLTVGYERFGNTTKKSDGTVNDYYAINMISIMGRFQVKYGSEYVKFYHRAYAGLNVTLIDGSANAEMSQPLLLPAYHITAVGFEAGKKVKFFADIGFGFLGLINAGIMIEF